jgi:hypothetical protein
VVELVAEVFSFVDISSLEFRTGDA